MAWTGGGDQVWQESPFSSISYTFSISWWVWREPGVILQREMQPVYPSLPVLRGNQTALN